MIFDLQIWALLFGVAAVLPLAIYWLFDALAPDALKHRLGDNYRIHLGAFSLLGTTMVLLGVLQNAGASIPNLWGIQALVMLAVVLATIEEAYKLPTQFALSFRVAIAVAAFCFGFHFHISENFGAIPAWIGWLADFAVTTIFWVGIMYTISMIDSMRGLAPGVVLIVAMTLLSLMVMWTRTDVLLLPLIIAGLCLGHLFLLGHDRHLHLGSIGQILLGVLLALSTVGSRTWGLTMTMLFVPLLACAAPIADRMYAKFARLRAGPDDGDYPAHLHLLLLKLGFSRRWVVLLYWIVTLQIGVLVHLVWQSKSLALAVAVVLSFAMLVLFPVACLLTLTERVEAADPRRPLRILFFSHYFHPEVNAPASRLYEHARRWRRAGHHVTVVCPVPSAPHGWPYRGYRNALWQEETVEGIRVVRIWTFIAANKGSVRRTLNYISFMTSSLLALVFLRRHDVIVATSPQFFCGLTGAAARLFRNERFILEIRDIWPESIAAVGASRMGLALKAVGALARWMYARADHIVTVGEGYRSKLLEIGAAPPERISVITNGIDFERFGEGADAGLRLMESWELRDKFVVSYIGTVGMAHGLGIVLDAAEKLRADNRVAFLVVGDGAELDRLRGEAERRDLPNVRFAGLVPKEAVPGILAGSGAALVHLRRTELFTTVLPSKLFEGMALRKPTILGVRGEAEKILREAGAGICIEPEDAAALAEAATRLASDPALCAELGSRAREYVLRNFDRDRLAGDYIATIRAVLDNVRGGDGGGTPLPEEVPSVAGERTATA